MGPRSAREVSKTPGHGPSPQVVEVLGSNQRRLSDGFTGSPSLPIGMPLTCGFSTSAA